MLLCCSLSRFLYWAGYETPTKVEWRSSQQAYWILWGQSLVLRHGIASWINKFSTAVARAWHEGENNIYYTLLKQWTIKDNFLPRAWHDEIDCCLLSFEHTKAHTQQGGCLRSVENLFSMHNFEHTRSKAGVWRVFGCLWAQTNRWHTAALLACTNTQAASKSSESGVPLLVFRGKNPGLQSRLTVSPLREPAAAPLQQTQGTSLSGAGLHCSQLLGVRATAWVSFMNLLALA